MNNTIDEKEISYLLDLEKKFQHQCLNYELSGTDEIKEKIELIMQLMDACQLKKDESSEEADLLKEMLQVNLISPEVAASILIQHFPDHGYTGHFIEEVLRRKSYSDYAVYCGIYYKARHDMVADVAGENLKKLNYLAEMTDEAMKIQQFFGEHYEGRLQNNWFEGRCAVYTIITGDYDNLADPAVVNPEWDYYCFTDCPDRFKSKIWKFKEIDTSKYGPVISQREVKMKPHVFLPEYDYTIYIDGKLGITGDLTRYISGYARESSMLCFPHPTRRTLQSEVDAIIYYGKADPNQIQKQIDSYQAEGYADDNLIAETACIVRSNHDEKLQKVMEDWFEEILKKSHRDQLSLGYVCWKNQFRFDVCDLNIYLNSYLEHHGHRG